jgi:hypothetical protein
MCFSRRYLVFLYTIHVGVEVVIAAVILYGAKTGDLFAACWPTATSLPTEDSRLLDSDAGSEFEPDRL